jgi:hypothetical protein
MTKNKDNMENNMKKARDCRNAVIGGIFMFTGMFLWTCGLGHMTNAFMILLLIMGMAWYANEMHTLVLNMKAEELDKLIEDAAKQGNTKLLEELQRKLDKIEVQL